MAGNNITKSMPIALALVLIFMLATFTLSCATETEETGRLRVAVSIPPQAEFVENVAGGRVDVTLMVPPGANPHTYEPAPSQMTDLSRAKMYAMVGSGIEFELAWMDKLAAMNQKMLITDCSHGIQLLKLADEQTSGFTDPHIWMSPRNAMVMTQNICNGLAQLDSDNRAYYERNLAAYQQKLTELDREIRDRLSGVKNRTFMVHHPSLAYFAQDYGLTILAIEREGKEPTAADLVELIEQAKRYNIKVVFASPQSNDAGARVIAEAVGGKVVFIDPLARDHIANMRTFLNELYKALE